MRRARIGVACAVVVLACVAPSSALALGELKFATAPALPALPAVTLKATSQTVSAAMPSFAVQDTRGTKSGWNVTVAGQAGEKKSAVLAQYCAKAKCGTDAEGYVAGGQKLPANSLTLNSTGAKFTGGTGSAPTLLCSTACNVDSASPVKIASAANGGAGESTWTAGSFSATSITLSVASTLRALSNEEVYRVNVLWTLTSGP